MSQWEVGILTVSWNWTIYEVCHQCILLPPMSQVHSSSHDFYIILFSANQAGQSLKNKILLFSIYVKPILTVECEGSATATWGDSDWRTKIQALGIRDGLKMDKRAAGEGRASLLLDLYLPSQWDEDEEEFRVGNLIEGIMVAVIPQHETVHTERRRRREWSGSRERQILKDNLLAVWSVFWSFKSAFAFKTLRCIVVL